MGPDTCWHREWFERMSRIQWVLTVEVEITKNQSVLRFDHVALKEVLELIQKKATVDLFMLDGGGRYITDSFIVDEALSVTSILSNDLVSMKTLTPF